MNESNDDRGSASADEARSIAFPCRRCRYEIRGISLDGRCPECGEPIWRTLAESVDLSAASIDPETCRRIGKVLPLVAVVAVAATILVALPPGLWPWTFSGSWLERVLGVGARSPTWIGVATALWSAMATTALLAVVGLREGGGSRIGFSERRLLDRPLRRPRILLLVGAAICGAAAATTALEHAGSGPPRGIAGPIGVAATGVLLLAAGLLAGRLGPGSRRWRSGGQARQSPWLVVGSLVAASGLSVLQRVLDAAGMIDLAAGATLLAAASMLLVVVGGIYLGVNLLWIAGDLRRRRPHLERLLRTGHPDRPGSVDSRD